MPGLQGSCPFKTGHDLLVVAATLVVAVGIVTLLLGHPARAAQGLERRGQLTAVPMAVFGPSIAQPDPLRLSDSALEPTQWDALKGWAADDHAAAFTTFVASCRPLLRAGPQEGNK
jgi:hypothetical protein